MATSPSAAPEALTNLSATSPTPWSSAARCSARSKNTRTRERRRSRQPLGLRGNWLQFLAQSVDQRRVEQFIILTIMCPAVAVWAKPNDLARMVRTVISQTFCVVGFQERRAIIATKWSGGFAAFAAPFGSEKDISANCIGSDSIDSLLQFRRC